MAQKEYFPEMRKSGAMYVVPLFRKAVNRVPYSIANLRPGDHVSPRNAAASNAFSFSSAAPSYRDVSPRAVVVPGFMS